MAVIFDLNVVYLGVFNNDFYIGTTVFCSPQQVYGIILALFLKILLIIGRDYLNS